MDTVFAELPLDLTISILERVKTHSLVGDDLLDSFVIRHCKLNAETMLHSLVKKKRLKSLSLYTWKHLKAVQCVSTACVKRLLDLSIKQQTFTISIHLSKVFVARLGGIYRTVLLSVINGYLRNVGSDEGMEGEMDKLVCRSHLAFLEYFLLFCRIQGVDCDGHLGMRLLPSILCRKHSQKLVQVLARNGCLGKMMDTVVDWDDSECCVRIMNAIIANNHIDLLNEMVCKGYEVMVCDVIVGIATGCYEMVKYLCRFFKPRWYSVKFREVLLTLASKREDDRILALVTRKLQT